MSLVGSPFRALWLAVFLFYLSFQLLVPVVPLYAVRLGASDVQLGLLTGLFAGTAMLLRPVVGQLTDSLGRRPLILLGSTIFAAAPLGYAAAGGLAALLALRVLHGSGMGFGQTAASVAAADLAPIARRGEALGVFGLASTFGIMLGPYAGIELYQRLGSTATFLVAASLAAGSVAVAATLPETRPPSAHAARPSGMLSVAAFYPSALYLAFFFGYGGIASFLPLFAEREQLGNPGLFYTLFALAGVAVRPGAGRLADRWGRRVVVLPALVAAGLALALLAAGRSPIWLGAAALLYGIGFGAGAPALMAMTTDRVPLEERGRAMGTFYTALELGIFAGAVLLGLFAERFGYRPMWWVAAFVAWLAAVAALRDVRRLRG